jgi:hypothetical protein
MLKNPRISVIMGSIYLIVYCICLSSDSLYSIAWFLFVFYPLLLAWVIFTILRPGPYQVTELNDDEFGYSDRQKDQLGIF